VDTASATDFMAEILDKISPAELDSITQALAEKSQRMQSLVFDREPGEPLDRAQLRGLLRAIFATRRRADVIIDEIGVERLGRAVDELLTGSPGLSTRFAEFDAIWPSYSEQAFDLPGELLHFVYPDQYWLWTRWMWDPRVETGALPLVTMDDVDLTGDVRGEVYLKVGEAVAFVDQTGKATGFTALGGHDAATSFGIDVYLAAVYGVYMYTVLRMRMTQEFNRLVPELPDLVRRLLGVHYREA
jgi:hypothetical protein